MTGVGVHAHNEIRWQKFNGLDTDRGGKGTEYVYVIWQKGSKCGMGYEAVYYKKQGGCLSVVHMDHSFTQV